MSTGLIKTDFSLRFFCALQFLKNILFPQENSGYGSFVCPPPPPEHYMPGKYVLNEIRLGARYLAVECHLARICSLDGNEGYEHIHLKEKSVIA